MFELFLTFAKIGVMTFGGGLAMLPMLERELVDNKGWIDKDTLMDYYAVGQCTPGIIAVNVATFVGKKKKGFLGGLFATLGIIFPSVVIITLIALFFSHFADNMIVKHAFAGARVGVCVLVLNSLIKLAKSSLKDSVQTIIYVLAAICAIFLKASPILVVVAAAVAGFAVRIGGLKK